MSINANLKTILALLSLTLMIGCSTRAPQTASPTTEYPLVQPFSTVTHTNINPIIQERQ